MHQRGSKTVTSSDGGSANVLDPQNHQLHPDCPRFNEWIDASLDATDTEVSHLVSGSSKKITKYHQKRCCRASTSSGYSSQSPPLSAGSYYPACGTNSGIPKSSLSPPPPPPHHHHCHQNSANRIAGVSSQNHQTIGPPSLAVIHEGETIPRPIWPYLGEDYREIGRSGETRCEMLDGEVGGLPSAARDHENCDKTNVYNVCDYCRADTLRGYRDSCMETTTASSAREVLLELSRTLNSVIDAETDQTPEEILRDISITVARSINRSKNEPNSSVVCEDYIYRLSSSSSSGAGKESLVGVNPVNLRVYGKPKWLHAPASSRSSSQCPYEAKNLLTASQKASRTTPAFGEHSTTTTTTTTQHKIPANVLAPAVFLVPQRNHVYPDATDIRRIEEASLAGLKSPRCQNAASGHFDAASRRITNPIGRLNGRPSENCGDKCTSGEPVYSTQLDGSDESSSYGAIGDSPAKNKWNEGSSVFDRHLDFTLDGNRAERLGRAIAKAKRKRQWCRGLTAVFGLVFFVLSVVIVSLSVTRGRKVFGSM